LFREGFFCYVLTFVLFFLKFHFVGTKQYFPSFHREYLSVNAAIAQAAAWALVGPVLWLFHDYVLRGTEMWRSFSELDWQIRRVLLGAVAGMATVTVLAWRVMLPFWGLVAAVALYMRFSRPKDSL
jgi:hypothetical protein